MDTHKITVGLAAFGGLVLVYVVYTHFQRTPQVIRREFETPAGRFADDVNDPLADVGLARVRVQNPTLKLYSDEGVVLREMGYRDMYVTRDENLLEVEHPFLNIYDPAFTCRVTADTGSVRLDRDSKTPFPQDATFKGNVVIHLEPAGDRSLEPCTVYLDDIVFLSEQSLFSSRGAIRFESPRLHVEGRGLESVYNDRDRRVEYFWLKDLRSLRVQVPESGLFFGRDEGVIAASDRAVANPVDANEAPEYSFERALASTYYRCQVRGNALIQSPRQVIYAERGIDLVELMWPEFPAASPAPDANAPTDANSAPVAEANEPTWVDVAITCDRGIMIAPEDVNTAIVDPCGLRGLRPRTDWREGLEAAAGQAFLAARDLRHQVLRRDTLAHGPVELSFFLDEEAPIVAAGPRVLPVTISARDTVRYEAVSGHLLLQGDSRCLLVKQDPNTVERYSLEAPRLAVELRGEGDKDPQAIASTTDLRHLRADGGDVVLRMIATAPAPAAQASATIVTGAEMLCRECDYDPQPGQEVFEALGPGQILFNNAAGPASQLARAAGDQPFYAGLEQFETLQYHITENRIVADGLDQQMQFHYFPLVDGRTDQHIQAQANHVELTLARDRQGALHLDAVTATGDVVYRDRTHNLHADGLTYDYETQWMEMWGKPGEPCFANGLPVTHIKFNLRTGELETEIPGLGTVVP